nr:MAG TPA: hypothetical protein [Caudoviricetes sp.]
MTFIMAFFCYKNNFSFCILKINPHICSAKTKECVSFPQCIRLDAQYEIGLFLYP